MAKDKPRTKADAPDAKEIVNALRAGTPMTFDQAAGVMHDYRHATFKYTKHRTNPFYPVLGHGERYTQQESLLATAEHYRGFMLGVEAAVAAIYGFEVRDRLIATYPTSREKEQGDGHTD